MDIMWIAAKVTNADESSCWSCGWNSLGVGGGVVEGVVVGIVVSVLVDMGGDYCRASVMLGDGDDEHVGIPAYLRLFLRSVK